MVDKCRQLMFWSVLVAKVNGLAVWCSHGEMPPRNQQCATQVRKAVLAGTSQLGDGCTDGQLRNGEPRSGKRSRDGKRWGWLRAVIRMWEAGFGARGSPDALGAKCRRWHHLWVAGLSRLAHR